MIIHTSQFGEVEVQENEIVSMTAGIPGFEDCTKFVFLQPDPEYTLSVMQSLDESALAFVVVNPFLYYPNYDFHLSDSVIEELHIQNEQEIVVWSIVTLRESIEDSTLNLQAPIIINCTKMIGKQVILHDSPYRTKHPLLPLPYVSAGQEE